MVLDCLLPVLYLIFRLLWSGKALKEDEKRDATLSLSLSAVTSPKLKYFRADTYTYIIELGGKKEHGVNSDIVLLGLT